MVILNEVVEASSSTTYVRKYDYDVFLSFRGVDTRLSFTSHLHTALVNANLTTFLDDEEIPTGEFLKPELVRAIKASKAYIIVLSENYASSSWCLDELVLILDQKRKYNQIVIPVFYHVQPTHIRKQQSSFSEAMEKQKLKMEAETNAKEKRRLAEKMEIWKNALTQVSNIKGKDAKGRLETELIDEIVNDVYSRLGVPLGTTTLPTLIGMGYYTRHIFSWISHGSTHSADILTILGVGGIGKTSLAKYTYELVCHNFVSCFVGDISRRCARKHHGLLDVQKQLCDEISKPSSVQVHDVRVYTSKIQKALARKKVLLVLDDVDSLDQLDALLGNTGLHPGSKVIITTKDASLTERCALFSSKVQPDHKKVSLNGLSEFASLELLCIHAFKRNKPEKDYKEVLNKLVKYCDGHPLALEVLGRSLYKRDITYWEDCIKGLKKETHSYIKSALQMSFDSLTLNDKNLFKHIACFFVGIDRYVTETILSACDLTTRSGITNLIDRCLLSIGRYNELVMHQLVQDMGRDLVCQEAPDKPWKRSRLWRHEESFRVLKQKKGSINILGLALDMRMLEKETLSGSSKLETDALCKMDNLKLLQLNYVQINGSYKNISKELRWLCMQGFHFKSIPSELPMKNLVVLDMSHSNIVSFDMTCSNSQRLLSRLKGFYGSSSNGTRLLGSLKILDLSFCEQLCQVCCFFELPSLERLIISNCTSLIHISESIGNCAELVFIDLSNCPKLKVLPRTIGKLKKVKTILSNGTDLSIFPMEMRDMDSLQMLMADNIVRNSQTSSRRNVEVIPRDMRSFMSHLPKSLLHLSIRNTNLSNESFPMDFSGLYVLKELYLDGNPIVSMPSCVSSLPRLELLSMNECTMLKTITRPPPTLRRLSLTSPSSRANYINYVSNILFDPEMSLLDLKVHRQLLGNSSFEIEGMVKIQPMADVQGKLLHSLGWIYLESIQNQQVKTWHLYRAPKSHVQIYYEFGIFSTFYWGVEIPNWISHRSKGSSISFTIPSSSKKLKGLNVCSLQKFCLLNKDFSTPLTVVSNITKNLTWIYNHYIAKVKVAAKGLIYLSHWMFGKNEMEEGDQLIITIAKKDLSSYCMEATECGISLVYDEEKEEDVLGYYKSWNHIIGGDLSSFQLTTGEYILHNDHFLFSYGMVTVSYYLPFVEADVKYKERNVRFRPFSEQKSDELDGMPKLITGHTPSHHVNKNHTPRNMFS